MGRRPRSRMCWSVLGVLVVSSLAASPMPRVRSTNPSLGAALADAESRSATFRALVQTIEATDGIVYVERGRCFHSVPACLSLSVVSAGGYRLLRILIDRVHDAISLMATIGHELRHAIEVLSEPGVTTTAAAYYFYARVAPTARDAFETPAAIDAGLAVERELRR